MTTRPSRSASIPIPRSSSSLSPSRNIESIISMPFAAPARPRVPSGHLSQRTTAAEDHRGLAGSYGTRGSTTVATAASPTRPTARSITVGTGASRRPLRALSTFEPRVVRVSGDQPRTGDPCLPSSTSPSRTRRPSGTGVRPPSAQRPSPAPFVPGPHAPVSFPRPTYLDHSALRHMLQTEIPPSLPPSRKSEQSPYERRFASAMSPPPDSDDESNFSPPRELAPPPPPRDEILRLPTRWSEQYRHTLLSISTDGRELSYHGTSCSGDRDAAAARTNNPIPPACGIYYYEVEITNKGQKGHISIGFAAREVKLSRLPGWESNSWGYHGDDGCSFAADKTGSGTPYGPTFGTGDIVGCGIDFTTHRAFFTKNGTLIGPVFDNIGKDVEIYPSVGLRHSGEHVRVNFGHEPFKFDIDYHVQQQQNNVWSKILTTPLDSSLLDISSPKPDPATEPTKKAPLTDEQTRDVINKLVLSYLEHHGYAKTMRTFQKQLDASSSAIATASLPSSLLSRADRDVQMAEAPSASSSSSAPNPSSSMTESDIDRRTKIVKSVVSGDIDTAISDTRTNYPGVLETEEGLILFKLRCRKFVELILEAAELKKRMQRSSSRSGSQSRATDHDVIADMDGFDEEGTGMRMDVDDEGAGVGPSSLPPLSMNGFASSSMAMSISGSSHRGGLGSQPPTDLGFPTMDGTVAQYEAALNEAISYGQSLSKSYKDDARPEVKQIFKRTFAIVAWEDPLSAPGTIAEVVGHEARAVLAAEVNQAILKSQGQPTDPMLETLYRHTAVCVAELGVRGVGGAAFADMQKEFLEG